jgi:protein CpxP
MKNVVKKLVVAMTLLVSFGVSAQDRKEKMKNATPEERVEMRTAKLSEKLGLDENQKKKVKEIFAAEQKENKVAREEMKAEREKMKAEREKAIAEKKAIMKKQHEELKAKLKPVLTEEQFKKWEAMQKENVDKVKAGRKHKKR